MAASGRDGVRMDDAEVQALLREDKKVQIASLGADGAPHLSTLFYVLGDDIDAANDGKIAFWTYGRSQKIVNLRRDPRVSALVEGGDDYFELRGVSISGTAEIVDDAERIWSIGSRVAVRMLDADSFEALGDFGRETVEKQAQKRVGVIIHPEKVASWDHRKL